MVVLGYKVVLIFPMAKASLKIFALVVLGS